MSDLTAYKMKNTTCKKTTIIVYTIKAKANNLLKYKTTADLVYIKLHLITKKSLLIQ